MTLKIGLATLSDVSALRELAVEQLPDLTKLHGPDDWSGRLGKGRTWVEPVVLVVRDSSVPGNTPIGFACVDAAMAHDNEVWEPWWCLNAIAVGSAYKGKGIGSALLDAVRMNASSAGVVSLHGICDRRLADWYTDRGFTVLEPGDKVVSDGPVRRYPPDGMPISFGDEEGECVFFTDIEPVAPRRLIRE